MLPGPGLSLCPGRAAPAPLSWSLEGATEDHGDDPARHSEGPTGTQRGRSRSRLFQPHSVLQSGPRGGLHGLHHPGFLSPPPHSRRPSTSAILPRSDPPGGPRQLPKTRFILPSSSLHPSPPPDPAEPPQCLRGIGSPAPRAPGPSGSRGTRASPLSRGVPGCPGQGPAPSFLSAAPASPGLPRTPCRSPGPLLCQARGRQARSPSL